MKSKIVYTLTLAILFTSCGTKKTEQNSGQIMTIQLDGKKYDQLFLKADVGGPNHSSNIQFFTGQSSDNNTWTFNIPDSINEMIDYYTIVTRPYDFSTNTYYCAKFKGLTDNDPSLYNFVFDEKNPIIKATYLETRNRTGVAGDGNYFIVNDTTIIDGGSRTEDIFRVDFKEKNTELELSIRFRSFSYLNQDSYENSFAEKDSISKLYPDSKYLMSKLREMFGDFKSVNDAKKIFDNFSEYNRATGFGKEIGSYVKLYSSVFDNISLKNAISGSIEPIVLDFTKFNLIIFSASWCSPCHKLIPDLKKIYSDLNTNLDMVYISVDEFKYVDDWIKLMKDNNIPWRSLLSSGRVKEIEDKYNAGSLPHMLLIYRDKSVKKIDLRNKADKEKLYELVNQKI